MLSILFVCFFGLVFFVCFWSSFYEIITFFTYIKLSKHSISVALFWYIWILSQGRSVAILASTHTDSYS